MLISPSLYNHKLKIGSYAPVGHRTKALKDNHQNRGSSIKHGLEQRITLKCFRLNVRSTSILHIKHPPSQHPPSQHPLSQHPPVTSTSPLMTVPNPYSPSGLSQSHLRHSSISLDFECKLPTRNGVTWLGLRAQLRNLRQTFTV